MHKLRKIGFFKVQEEKKSAETNKIDSHNICVYKNYKNYKNLLFNSLY